MKRPLVVAGIVAATVAMFSPDLDACGDKSLSAGGIRIQRAQAALYPASVLIYVEPNSRMAEAARALKLQNVLREYGHSYREVSTSADFDAALGSGQFNVVMADYTRLPEIKSRIDASASRPATIGVGYKLTKEQARDAGRQYRFLINAPSRAAQYVSTIAEAVKSKGSGQSRG